MCVVRVRASPHPTSTSPYSPSAQRHLALRGHSHCRVLVLKSTNRSKGHGRGHQKKGSPPRRGKPIEVWVTDEEKATITERAEEAGMSRSGYLRALGLNTPIRSVVDLAAVVDLAKVNGDLGRVAGLLKLWLLEKRGQGADAIDVELMMEFKELQVGIRKAMSAIMYGK